MTNRLEGTDRIEVIGQSPHFSPENEPRRHPDTEKDIYDMMLTAFNTNRLCQFAYVFTVLEAFFLLPLRVSVVRIAG